MFAVVTPVRDEARFLPRTIESMARQTVLPSQWIIVDDGSADGTGEIAEAHAKQLPWISVIRRPDRGRRSSGTGVIEAFQAGFAALRGKNSWDFLVKLDGDLSFDTNYFHGCLKEFASDARLGIGGGTVCRIQDGRLEIDSSGDPPFHVRGATKIYRRACWEQIEPLAKAPGWDTIDEVKANRVGWTTRTFDSLHLVQHRATGGADGRWRNWFKNGVANYMAGYHPVFMLAKCAKRAAQLPPFAESSALIAGYCSGYIRHLPCASDEATVQYLRSEQIRRLFFRDSIYRSRVTRSSRQ